MIDRKEIMKNEIELIENKNLKEFAYYCLERIPEYFFTIPASSTGKYHPVFTLGKGGLVRHTKAAVRIADELLRLDMYEQLKPRRDEIIFALIFHDSFKSGKEKSEYTVHEHPVLASEFIDEMFTEYTEKDNLSVLSIGWIKGGIASHMGQWNKNNYSDIVLPLPEEKHEKFIHQCDYLASRKFINMEV